MTKCPICLNDAFRQNKILKERLITEWELSPSETDYINKQQGFHCTSCSSSLRSMTLASGIMNHFSFNLSFQNFPYSRIGKNLSILEINEACDLHRVLEQCVNYTYAEFPDVDIQNLPYADNTYDVIVHSDTLEHVENSLLGLKECYRVLKEGGVLFYTIPIIYARLSRRRDTLTNSFHGSQEESQGDDYKVWTEYGADFWVEIINAGFNEITLNTIDDLSSIGICAKKTQLNILKDKSIPYQKLVFRQLKNNLKKYF